MHIRIETGGTLTLVEPDNFKKFHIETADPALARDVAVKALAPIATAEGEDFWVDAERLKALSGRAGDTDWVRSFEAMLAAVKRFGWVSEDGRKVKAHMKKA